MLLLFGNFRLTLQTSSLIPDVLSSLKESFCYFDVIFSQTAVANLV